MADMQFFTDAPSLMDNKKETNKADKDIAECSSQLSPSKHDQATPTPIGVSPRLDTPENLEADLESFSRLQTSATSSSCPPSASFRLAPNALGRLELLLAHICVARFSYDFTAQSVHIMMVETTVHNQCNRAIGTLLESAIKQLANRVAAAAAAAPAAARRSQLGHDNNADTENHHDQNDQDEAIEQTASLCLLSRRIRQVWSDNTVRIVVPGKLNKDPDNQFIDYEAASTIPPFVVEISYSQSLEDAKNKAKLYMECTDGHIRTVLILDIHYPDISSIRVHLFAAHTTAAGRPALQEVQSLTLFDFAADAAAEQDHGSAAGLASSNPGPLRLFASDFLSIDAQMPARLKRPIPLDSHGDEIVQAEIPFDNLREACLRARELHLKKQEKQKGFM